MSKTLALNVLSSIGATGTSATTTWMIASGQGISTGLVTATAVLSLFAIVGTASIVLGELAKHRACQQHHMGKLKKALTA